MAEKVIYTGYFVDDPGGLLEQVPPRITSEGARVFAHHVTREFRPANGVEGITPGRERTFMAVGQVVTAEVHVLLVESLDGDIISTNPTPHLTIATAEGIPPARSNDAIAAAQTARTILPLEQPIPIGVTEGYFNGRDVITE